MAGFTGIQEFMERLPIQKALNQHLVFRSHIKRFWENATYDEENKTINSVVNVYGQHKPIIITEQLVREVIDFPDDVDSPTKFPERMIKGCMLRKGGYDAMKDYQMNMVTTLVLNKKYNFSKIVFHYLVENITSKSKTWVYPRFIQMMIDHAYPDLERNENNDLYYPNHPEPSSKVEFFGFIKDKNYQDPDPVNHQNWRNEEEMNENSYADELKDLKDFRESRNEWFLKEEKKKKGRKATPKVQEEEGSSSQPKCKRQKKKVETMLADEPDEDEPKAEAETEAEVNVEGDFNAEQEKTADDVEGDDGDKSSSSSSDEEIDETEHARRVQAEIEKEKQLKRKRKKDKEDELYNPSPEHVLESQTPPSSGWRKKQSARKKVAPPKAKDEDFEETSSKTK
ncbi:hypothetical protein Hdeb2414_s0012g00390481 [Helianthus debilis subsp. tardiflorus]